MRRSLSLVLGVLALAGCPQGPSDADKKAAKTAEAARAKAEAVDLETRLAEGAPVAEVGDDAPGSDRAKDTAPLPEVRYYAFDG